MSVEYEIYIYLFHRFHYIEYLHLAIFYSYNLFFFIVLVLLYTYIHFFYRWTTLPEINILYLIISYISNVATINFGDVVIFVQMLHILTEFSLLAFTSRPSSTAISARGTCGTRFSSVTLATCSALSSRTSYSSCWSGWTTVSLLSGISTASIASSVTSGSARSCWSFWTCLSRVACQL